jgi:hypothetical protein
MHWIYGLINPVFLVSGIQPDTGFDLLDIRPDTGY